jgi:hypothetical protein
MADRPHESVPGAWVQDSTPVTPTGNARVPPAVASATFLPDGKCDLCAGSGVIRWMQPDENGVLRELEHPCIRGCGGWLKHPDAERSRVVDVLDPTELGDQ